MAKYKSEQHETLVHWLNDAYAMERAQIDTLENHVKDADAYPEVQRRMREHLERTHTHADLVRQCVERLGGDVSTLKTAIGKVGGFFSGVGTGAAKDEMVKNGLVDYSSEHFEIASYKALIAAASALGEHEVAQICREILRDEEEMARWLESRLPDTVHDFLQTKGGEARLGGAGYRRDPIA